jgi:steroid delta-isomerase-like uncharacterized protein
VTARDEQVREPVVDRHFAAENAHDVAATLATYTDDIVWDDVTHPLSPVHGKDAVGAVYSDIMDAIPDVRLETVRRLEDGSGTFVVDESILTGHVDGAWAGIYGEGAPVRVRILHVFNLTDGLISRENTWFDSAEVTRQVLGWKERRDAAADYGDSRTEAD